MPSFKQKLSAKLLKIHPRPCNSEKRLSCMRLIFTVILSVLIFSMMTKAGDPTDNYNNLCKFVSVTA